MFFEKVTELNQVSVRHCFLGIFLAPYTICNLRDFSLYCNCMAETSMSLMFSMVVLLLYKPNRPFLSEKIYSN